MITKQIAAALQQPEPLTASQYAELNQQASQRFLDVEARLNTIRPASTKGGSVGPERHRILITGSVKEVQALDEEYADLKVESEQLRAQRNELSVRLRAAKGREALDGMPGQYDDLASLLRKAAKARAAYAAALRDIEASLLEIERTRVDANRAGLEVGRQVAAAPASLYSQLDALRPSDDLSSHLLFGRHSDERLDMILGTRRPRTTTAA